MIWNYFFGIGWRVNTESIEESGFKLVEKSDETSKTFAWKAIQETLNRTVILRLLKPEFSAIPDEVDHFLSIARLISRIKSDSLVAVFDIVSKGDLHYIVLEYVEGPSLEEVLDAQGPLSVEQALRVAVSVIHSLEQMWDTARLVHRNLKSSIIRIDPRGVAKITDFSLAVVAGPGMDTSAMDGGSIVGTPSFISPEQAQGANTNTVQSDMYALGAMLYHLTTKNVPFQGLDVLSVLEGHVRHQIQPPHLLMAEIPVTFSWFLHRLMMKDPLNRYPTWSAALDDIQTILEGGLPGCVRPDEEYLSTIEEILESVEAETDGEEGSSKQPQIRINRANKKSDLTLLQSQKIADEHAAEIQKTQRDKERILWGVLSLWLIAFFWYRAAYHADDAAKGQATPLDIFATDIASQVTEAIDKISIFPRNGATETNAVDNRTEKSADPAPAPTVLPAKTNHVAAPVKPVPKAPVEAPKPLPANMPAGLQASLAYAFAKGDVAEAKRVFSEDTSEFQTRKNLEALFAALPAPDKLVEDYLKRQIGRPLILTHGGKRRTVIPRGVENGVIQIEANGRGTELPISRLTPDEKLNWMTMPPANDEAKSVAYSLILMRSSRSHDAADFITARCPQLAPVLKEAAATHPSP